jgi:hypothetical protein
MNEDNRANHSQETLRYTEDMDSLRLQTAGEADASWGVERWVEEEKKRLWLGYFSIKL